jgi:hypothetical protein
MDDGLITTLTDATGTSATTTFAAALTPEALTLMLVVPTCCALTTPVVVTLATEALDVDHATLTASSALPNESRGIATKL